jgi:hypothetical protein
MPVMKAEKLASAMRLKARKAVFGGAIFESGFFLAIHRACLRTFSGESTSLLSGMDEISVL